MTFKTTAQNTFKKDPLKGLEYNQTEYRVLPVVEIWAVMMLIAAIIIAVYRIWFFQPEQQTAQPEEQEIIVNLI